MAQFKFNKTTQSPSTICLLPSTTTSTSQKPAAVVPIGPPLGQTGGKLSQKEAVIRVLLRTGGNGIPLPSIVI
ncbi:hypothetical protein EC957_007266 [Mortierella hygrophila]|uniref:Uncharacterized protein n=1 Tax=Mortierella hygrophila TaxID=979708 RepID=A0A9P6EYB9_9FUNG|nr:hypothetical protein EC957_007266 [Mortierella hygrophila]